MEARINQAFQQSALCRQIGTVEGRADDGNGGRRSPLAMAAPSITGGSLQPGLGEFPGNASEERNRSLGHHQERRLLSAGAFVHGSSDTRSEVDGSAFLTRHLELIVAADFLHREVWTARSLERFLVLFFI